MIFISCINRFNELFSQFKITKSPILFSIGTKRIEMKKILIIKLCDTDILVF